MIRMKLIRAILGKDSPYVQVRMRKDILEMAKQRANKKHTTVANYLAHLVYNDVNK